jgi:hypothetical protein
MNQGVCFGAALASPGARDLVPAKTNTKIFLADQISCFS